MAQKLHDIRPGEVSLVRRGANRRRFLLAKADTGELDRELLPILAAPSDHEVELLDAIRKSGGDESVEKAAAAYSRLGAALRDAYGEAGVPDEVLKAARKQLVEEDQEDLDNGAADDDETELSKADAAAGDLIFKDDFTAEQRQAMAKSGEAMSDGSYPIPNKDYLQRAIRAVGRGKNNSHDAIRKHIETRARALGATDLLPDSWDVKKEDTMTETTTVPIKKEDGTWDLSGVPEEQRPALELVLKMHDDELAELRKEKEVEKSKADEAIEIAKSERETRETREYIAKAETLDKVAQDPAEFGPVLKSIANAERDGHVPEGTFEKLETVLKSANEAIEKGDLFSELGRVGGTGATDADAKIDAAAAELRKSDPKLTKEQAIAKALEDNPELYVDYRKAVA